MKIPNIHLGDFLGKCWWIFQHHGAYGFGIKLKACWKDLENSPALLEDYVQWRSHCNLHFLLGIPQVAKFNDAAGYSWLLLPASLWCLDQTHIIVSLLETQIFVVFTRYINMILFLNPSSVSRFSQAWFPKKYQAHLQSSLVNRFVLHKRLGRSSRIQLTSLPC